MKKLFVLLPIVAVITACSSFNKKPEPVTKAETVVLPRDEYEARAVHAVAKREKQVENSISRAPEWMSVLPISDNAVYANGSGVSMDMSMADYKAKLFAYGKICMAAGGQVSQQAKLVLVLGLYHKQIICANKKGKQLVTASPPTGNPQS